VTGQNDRNGAGTKRAFRSVVKGFFEKGVKNVVEFHQLEKRGSVQVPGLRAFEPRGFHALITGTPNVVKSGQMGSLKTALGGTYGKNKQTKCPIRRCLLFGISNGGSRKVGKAP